MHNKYKMILLAVILIVSLTACKAVRKHDYGNNEPIPAEQTDTLTTATYTPGEWITSYPQALKLSKDTGLPIFADFTGSDWCIWCQRLSREVFQEKAFIDYAKVNLILLKLDFPKSLPQSDAEKQQNRELADKFKIEGYPTIVLLDKEGAEIARTGYREGGAGLYVNHLKLLLKK